MPLPDSDFDLMEITASVASAYVEKNPVPVADLANLIADISSAFGALSQPVVVEAPQPVQRPFSVRKSLGHDYLLSFEDGKKYKTLRRHLAVRGITPEEYRAKWDLPHDYPMVAASYSQARSAMAKELGLGRKAVESAKAKPPKGGRASSSTKPKKARN